MVFKVFQKLFTFSVIGRCSLVLTSHCLHGKYARINLPQVASGMTLQTNGQLPVCIFIAKITAQGLGCGLLEGFSKLESNFIVATSRLIFSSTKKQVIV
jgi:hypothetical protein